MKNMLCAGVIAIWATSALAHSPLDGTIPANEAILSEMPAEVLMNFKGNIRLTRVTLTHAGSSVISIDLGEQKTFTQEYTLPMQDMGLGTYVIGWRGLGADGHALNGTFSFTVEQ
jgi:methionine-rich copper-binding protein CopC|tara:strand:- start:218 stop:562 length:345 start_codon:yes stop_codon:yes gene_type:complete